MAHGGSDKAPAMAHNSRQGLRRRGRRKVSRRYGATVDETGSGKPEMSEAPRARETDLDLILELHTGQRPVTAASTGRTHGSTSTTRPAPPQNLLASRGASTHGHSRGNKRTV